MGTANVSSEWIYKSRRKKAIGDDLNMAFHGII